MIPAVSASGAAEAARWAAQAAEAGADAVMSLPPNSYRADERSVVEHFRAVAEVGLPVIAYNNPTDTKVDLTPALLARLHSEGLIVAVKEFSGDPRRAYATRELAPELDVLVGSDDTVLEITLAGGKGWISGYTERLSRLLPRALSCFGGRESRGRATAVSHAASVAAMGLQDRVRTGDQAVDGHRGSWRGRLQTATGPTLGRARGRDPQSDGAGDRRRHDVVARRGSR